METNVAARAPLIIAVDGPAGSGKSTVARLLARRLGIPHLDTGAMYRAAALLALRHGLRPPLGARDRERAAELVAAHRIEVEPGQGAVRVLVDGEDVSDAIRTPECSGMASVVSAVSKVREQLVVQQRSLGRRAGGVVEGRDIGSVVFPDATLKVFLTASCEERARRRQRDLARTGVDVPLEEVLRQQEERDARDSTRVDSPLITAAGARNVDTTTLTTDQVVDILVAMLADRGTAAPGSGGAIGQPPGRSETTLDSTRKTP